MHKKTSSNPAGFAKLQRGLTGDRSLIGGTYMENPAMLAAYLDFYWPISRAQAAHAIALSSRFYPAAKKVLDVGSGPGPVAAAFIDAGAEAVFLVDQSRKALDLALRELPRRCRHSPPFPHLSILACGIENPDPAKIPLWGAIDCISFGHSLNELFSGDPARIEKRVALLARYAEGLAAGGRILVIEPALLSTSRDLLSVRNLLVERGWKVRAPCVGRDSLPCPALEAGPQHTCHEEVFWKIPLAVERLADSMKLDKESLKMTWFFLEPPGVPIASDTGIYRVVSDPMLNKAGRVRRLICGAAGRFPLSAAGDSKASARVSFDALRRGDFIRVENPEIRGNGWGVGDDTVIEVVGGKK